MIKFKCNWHNRKAKKYSDIIYDMKETAYMYRFYKAKFTYHYFMYEWYEKLLKH